MPKRAVTVNSAVIRGCESVPIRIQVAFQDGIPGITVVGVPENQVLETRSRIRCAIRACGFEIPRKGISIAVTPDEEVFRSELRWDGIDLPIAAAILELSNQIPSDFLKGCSLYGRLELDGRVSARHVPVITAGRGDMTVLTAAGCPTNLMCEEGSALGIPDLGALRAGLDGASALSPLSFAPAERLVNEMAGELDSDTARSLMVAATGRHSMLALEDNSGSWPLYGGELGRVMSLAYAELLDEQTPVELDRTSILSSFRPSIRRSEPILPNGQRPITTVLPTDSLAYIVGGGRPVQPGAMTSASGGVLLLEDAVSMDRRVLQSVRAAAQDSEVRITRAGGTYSFPADVAIVASSPLLPPSGRHSSAGAIDRYVHALERCMNGLGGVIVAAPDPDAAPCETTTTEALERVRAGREFAATCATREVPAARNPWMQVARSIADLDRSPAIQPEHEAEARAMMSLPKRLARARDGMEPELSLDRGDLDIAAFDTYREGMESHGDRDDDMCR